jgi:hypothetical protein
LLNELLEIFDLIYESTLPLSVDNFGDLAVESRVAELFASKNELQIVHFWVRHVDLSSEDVLPRELQECN